MLVGAGKLPGHVFIEPQIGLFHLLAVNDFLLEHAVLIADAVAHGRNAQSGQRIEETRGQAAEAAVAQARVFFFFAHFVKIDAQLAESLDKHIVNAFVNQRIGKGAAQQKFHR